MKGVRRNLWTLPIFTAVVGSGLFAATWTYNIYKKVSLIESDNWFKHVENNHSELEEIRPGLYQVSADFLTISSYRNMTIYTLKSGGLMIHSPIALPESVMEQIESLGSPKLLVIPTTSLSSYSDAIVYKQRYPSSKLLCPEAVTQGLTSRNVPLDGTTEEYFKVTSPEEGVIVINPPLVKLHDQILDVPLPQSPQRALIGGELLWNLKFDSGLIYKLLAISKMAGDGVQPQIPSAIHAYGFRTPEKRTKFYKKLSEYVKGTISDPRYGFDIPSYAAFTLSHGSPIVKNIDSKLQKVAEVDAL